MAPSALEALYPSNLQIEGIGNVRKFEGDFMKDWQFKTINYSIILKGSGVYEDDGQLVRVKAPYVITQFEEKKYTYGPQEGESWHELYLVYPRIAKSAFQKANLYSPDRTHWPIQNSAGIEQLISQIHASLMRRNSDGVIDTIGRMCEMIVLESIRVAPRESKLPYFDRLLTVKDRINLEPGQTWDFESEAGSVSMSYSAFRKYWKAYFKTSPQKYLNNRRIQEAQRLLAETSQSIGDIAESLGYEDQLYFSRKFKMQTGHAPTGYRSLHELPTSRPE